MIQGIAIALAVGITVGASAGWYAKGRDVKADQAEVLEKSLVEFQATAQGTIDNLQQSWEEQAQLNYENLLAAGQLRTADNEHEAAVLEQIEENNRELRGIIEGFALATDLGACQLTPEFVGLWNQARAAVTQRASIYRDPDPRGDH